MTVLRSLFAAMLLAAPAAAQHAGDCDTWQANARNLAWPGEDATRVFEDGAVRLIALDTGEPAVAWAHLMVTWAPIAGPGSFCSLISLNERGLGFAGMVLPEVSVERLSDTQSQFTLPIQRHNPDSGLSDDAVLRFTLYRDMNEIAIN